MDSNYSKHIIILDSNYSEPEYPIERVGCLFSHLPLKYAFLANKGLNDANSLNSKHIIILDSNYSKHIIILDSNYSEPEYPIERVGCLFSHLPLKYAFLANKGLNDANSLNSKHIIILDSNYSEPEYPIERVGCLFSHLPLKYAFLPNKGLNGTNSIYSSVSNYFWIGLA